MDRRWMLVLVVGLLTEMAGCRSLARPNWGNPGPAALQQARAQQFDPYPENESGPEIVGARPMGYEKPTAEILRTRWLPWNWGRQ